MPLICLGCLYTRSVQFSCSVVSDSATAWTAAHQASPSITNPRSLLKLMSIESVMTSNHLILCCPLLLPSVLPMIFQDWFHLGLIGWISLQSKGLFRVFSKHHSSKASILWHWAFFTVQLSDPYMTTGNTIALTRRTLVGKVMSLLFNMLSSLVIAFLPRSKCLLISWLSHHLQWFWSPPK